MTDRNSIFPMGESALGPLTSPLLPATPYAFLGMSQCLRRTLSCNFLRCDTTSSTVGVNKETIGESRSLPCDLASLLTINGSIRSTFGIPTTVDPKETEPIPLRGSSSLSPILTIQPGAKIKIDHGEEDSDAFYDFGVVTPPEDNASRGPSSQLLEFQSEDPEICERVESGCVTSVTSPILLFYDNTVLATSHLPSPIDDNLSPVAITCRASEVDLETVSHLLETKNVPTLQHLNDDGSPGKSFDSAEMTFSTTSDIETRLRNPTRSTRRKHRRMIDSSDIDTSSDDIGFKFGLTNREISNKQFDSRRTPIEIFGSQIKSKILTKKRPKISKRRRPERIIITDSSSSSPSSSSTSSCQSEILEYDIELGSQSCQMTSSKCNKCINNSARSISLECDRNRETVAQVFKTSSSLDMTLKNCMKRSEPLNKVQKETQIDERFVNQKEFPISNNCSRDCNSDDAKFESDCDLVRQEETIEVDDQRTLVNDTDIISDMIMNKEITATPSYNRLKPKNELPTEASSTVDEDECQEIESNMITEKFSACESSTQQVYFDSFAGIFKENEIHSPLNITTKIRNDSEYEKSCDMNDLTSKNREVIDPPTDSDGIRGRLKGRRLKNESGEQVDKISSNDIDQLDIVLGCESATSVNSFSSSEVKRKEIGDFVSFANSSSDSEVKREDICDSACLAQSLSYKTAKERFFKSDEFSPLHHFNPLLNDSVINEQIDSVYPNKELYTNPVLIEPNVDLLNKCLKDDSIVNKSDSSKTQSDTSSLIDSYDTEGQFNDSKSEAALKFLSILFKETDYFHKSADRHDEENSCKSEMSKQETDCGSLNYCAIDNDKIHEPNISTCANNFTTDGESLENKSTKSDINSWNEGKTIVALEGPGAICLVQKSFSSENNSHIDNLSENTLEKTVRPDGHVIEDHLEILEPQENYDEREICEELFKERNLPHQNVPICDNYSKKVCQETSEEINNTKAIQYHDKDRKKYEDVATNQGISKCELVTILSKLNMPDTIIEEATDDEKDADTDVTIRIKRSPSLRCGKTPPGTPGRKKIVRFADALGLDLAAIRTYLDGIPNVPTSAFCDLKIDDDPVVETKIPSFSSYSTAASVAAAALQSQANRLLIPMFQQPSNLPDFHAKLHYQKVVLESVSVGNDLGVKGIVRVINEDYHKRVIVRYTFDHWKNFHEATATYVEGTSDGYSDKFSFLLWGTFLQANGALIFCVKYSVKGKDYWDSNQGENYVLRCYTEKSFKEKHQNSGFTDESSVFVNETGNCLRYSNDLSFLNSQIVPTDPWATKFFW